MKSYGEKFDKMYKELLKSEFKVISEPEKWCVDGRCHDTNWGGYDRLHTRGSECPEYVSWNTVTESAQTAKKLSLEE